MGAPPRGGLNTTADRLDERVRPSASATCWAARQFHSLARQTKDAGYLPRFSGVVGEGFALVRASAFF